MQKFFLFIGVLTPLFLLAQESSEPDEKKPCCYDSSCSLMAMDMSSLCSGSCALADYDPSVVAAPLTAKIGDLVKCPVSGVVFEVTERSTSVKYDEREVYVCCGACAAVYALDPAKYEENILDTRS